MIDHKTRENSDYMAWEIWQRLNDIEKSEVKDLFPQSKSLRSPEVRDFLLKKYRDRLIEVVIK